MENVLLAFDWIFDCLAGSWHGFFACGRAFFFFSDWRPFGVFWSCPIVNFSYPPKLGG